MYIKSYSQYVLNNLDTGNNGNILKSLQKTSNLLYKFLKND